MTSSKRSAARCSPRQGSRHDCPSTGLFRRNLSGHAANVNRVVRDDALRVSLRLGCRNLRGAKVNPHHPQRASTPQAAHQARARFTYEGSVLSSRDVSPDADDGTVPLIMLRSRRLTRLGFRAGARIRIDVSVGGIVIKLVGVKAPVSESMPLNFSKYQRERPRRSTMRCERPLQSAGLSRLPKEGT